MGSFLEMDRTARLIGLGERLVRNGKATKVGDAYLIKGSQTPEEIQRANEGWGRLKASYNKRFYALQLREDLEVARAEAPLRDLRYTA